MKYNIEEFNHLIKNRRAAFPPQYSDEKIDKEIIEQILENANWAPTHGRTEPWRFVVFTGEGLKKLADFQSGLYKKNNPGDTFDENKFEKFATQPLKASHIIAIMMKRQESGKIPEIEEIEATACAVQNMWLTATAYGLGAYWSSGVGTYAQAGKDFFGLGENDKLLGFFYLGHIAKASPEGTRTSIADKVKWIED